MNNFYLLRRCFAMMALAVSGVGYAAVPEAPVVCDYRNYTGDSFDADWSDVNGCTNYVLNVFSQNTGDLVSATETFSGLNVTDGAIDTQNPNFPDGWTVGAAGTTVVDGENRVTLTADGEYLYFYSNEGVIKSMSVSASVVNAPGITSANSAKFKVELYNGANELMVYGETYVLLFSQIATLDLAAAFGGWPENVAGVKVSVTKADANTIGDLVINSIAYSYYTRDYVLRDQVVDHHPYTVSDVDPEGVYYYYVQAQNDEGVSSRSDIMTVDGFLTPSGMRHEVVNSSSYTAFWNEVPKAEGYEITNYKVTCQDGDEMVILYDDFSKALEGTVDEPVAITDPDAYTSLPGWGGNRLAIAEGMFGTQQGAMFPPPMRSSVTTPELDLSANDGNYVISIKAYGTPGNTLALYRMGYTVDGQLNIHRVTFDENGWAEETWSMTDGVAGMKISIEESGLKQFLIDEISITQASSDDACVKTFLGTYQVKGKNNTSYTFTGLTSDETYGFEVRAVRTDRFGSEEQSGSTELYLVTLSSGASVDLPDTDVSVSLIGNNLTVDLAEATAVSVYDIDGRMMYADILPAGVTTVSLDIRKNVYILRIGGKSYKVMVR